MRTLILTAALLTLIQPAMAQTCLREGDSAPLALHKSWIIEGWERKEGDGAFVFAKKMRRYYDLGAPAGVFYDNFAPGPTQLFDNAATYGANWEALQNGARSVLHALTEGHDQIVGDDIASTTIGFVGTLTRENGDVLAFDGRSQVGWLCTDEGWKIRQELNYAWPVKPEAIAPYYQKANAR